LAKNKKENGTLEAWLWEAACKIRGEIDAPKYKDYILPIIFIKRLSDVYDNELDKLAEEYGDKAIADQLVNDDHSLVRFYIPEAARWPAISSKNTGLGEILTDAVRSIARENPKLSGVVDVVDFNATTAGQRIISDDGLRALIDVLGSKSLGLKDVESDILGNAYEYLLRKFSEGSGQSAGEFFTPSEVAMLMANIIDPEPGESFYDPTCGTGGLLIKSILRFREKYGDSPAIEPIRVFGQEISHATFAMAKMNAFIHDMEAEIGLGDTMKRPAFLNSDGSLRKFKKVMANPMWNQDFEQSTYENDAYNRFGFGYPTSSSADWGWIQHMFSSLKDDGKMAVVLDTGAVARGSGSQGSNRERNIRKEFVDKDLVEAVILMPENLFYNTTAPGIILIINKAKKKANEIMLINASKLFEKGRPKNFLPEENIRHISDLYLGWMEEDGTSKIATNEVVTKNDYNLSPSRYVAQNGADEVLPLEDAWIMLKEAEEKRKIADSQLHIAMAGLGIHE
jgi:type I restriction enzyme M protein